MKVYAKLDEYEGLRIYVDEECKHLTWKEQEDKEEWQLSDLEEEFIKNISVYSLLILAPNPLEHVDPYDEEEGEIKGVELIEFIKHTLSEKKRIDFIKENIPLTKG